MRDLNSSKTKQNKTPKYKTKLRNCKDFLYSSSVQFSHSVVSNSLWPHGLQHAKLPCPSPTPRAYSNSCPSSGWCCPTISSSVIPISSCFQSFPTAGSFPMSWFITSGGQNIGVSASASVLPINIQDWFPLGWTGWTTLLGRCMIRTLYIRKLRFRAVR